MLFLSDSGHMAGENDMPGALFSGKLRKAGRHC